nr:cupin domain-containing protein [Phaeobacter sp. 11ANDIMAR09]
MTIKDQVFLSGVGDTIQFASDQPHGYRNPGPGLTRLLSAVTPPHY